MAEAPLVGVVEVELWVEVEVELILLPLESRGRDVSQCPIKKQGAG